MNPIPPIQNAPLSAGRFAYDGMLRHRHRCGRHRGAALALEAEGQKDDTEHKVKPVIGTVNVDDTEKQALP